MQQTLSGLYIPASFADETRRSSRPEMREVATTFDGRDITRGYVDPMQIQPSSDSILQLRGAGDYEIYRQVLRDDQVAGVFQQRQLAITSKEWGVDPGGKTKRDKAAADFLTEQLHHIGWDRVTGKMMYGVFYGFAAAEAMYARDGRFITLDAIKVRDRQRFGWDGAMRLRMKTYSNPQGELLPDRKFWAFSTGADHDDEPYGLGLAHWLYWPVLFKRNGIKFWMIFLEKFGQPTAKGSYPSTALPDEKTRLLQALSAINTDSGIIVPQGMEIELLEAARSGSADYVSLVDRMDRAIAKVVMGQVASSEGTPGRLGNDDLQGDVREDLVKADADLVCESFNRTIARWLTEWNFPGAAVPRVYRKVTPDEDLNERAERDKTIVDMGYFKPKLGYITENYGEGWEEKQPDPAPPVKPGVQPVPVESGTQDAPDVPASFAEAIGQPPLQMMEQARQSVEPNVSAWINQVRELANQVDTLEELRDRLLETYPAMTLDQYAAAMAQAGSAAFLAGRNEVKEEQR
ncbi:DUF935 domain-containing protein [Marinobacterium litorale]|uniref:DUF935 domain-containing protein n=1 Tax=Marinobacterium litorale TaxID=404770 RepID=UPI00040A3E18|nr:DUF935 family protein [Marinobacterium litorale]